MRGTSGWWVLLLLQVTLLHACVVLQDSIDRAVMARSLPSVQEKSSCHNIFLIKMLTDAHTDGTVVVFKCITANLSIA
jgi:hypothetical protein